MKLLFDENLSPQLVRLLSDLFPIPFMCEMLACRRRMTRWSGYARNHELMICSKDSDMHQRSFLFGYPPNVVWVRLGKCSTSDVANLLRKHFAAVEAFAADDYASFLILS